MKMSMLMFDTPFDCKSRRDFHLEVLLKLNVVLKVLKALKTFK